MGKNWTIDEDELVELIALKYFTVAKRGQFTPSEIMRVISHTVKGGSSLYNAVAIAVQNMISYRKGCDYEICLNPSKDGLLFSHMALDSIYVSMVNGALRVEHHASGSVERLLFYSMDSFLLAVLKIEGWLNSEPEREFFSNFIDLVLGTKIIRFKVTSSLYQEFVDWAKSKNYEIQSPEREFNSK